jgi:ribonuclease HII
MLRNTTNNNIFVGCDCVGEGSCIGPVVSAVVIWNPTFEDENLKFIQDSKKISKKQRELLADFIKENAIDYSISFIDNETIDKYNILNAAHMAMHKALSTLNVDFDHILVDGNKFPKYKDKDHTCIVKGDNTYLIIAAASILAKTARDEYINNLSIIHPEYNWDTNMGYGTKKHLEAIKNHGLTRYHRVSFAPCSSYINSHHNIS